MNKYIGITIGPVIKTLMMARKPRELFSASYLLSYLTKCIMEELRKEGGNNTVTILSPAYYNGPEKSERDGGKDVIQRGKTGIGLYPDRVFYKLGEDDPIQIKEILEDALNVFKDKLFKGAKDDFINNYFKISALQIEALDDRTAIQALNRLLDGVELSNPILLEETVSPVLDLIRKKKDSLLYEEALGNKDFKIDTLGIIAAASLDDSTDTDDSNWKLCKDIVKNCEYAQLTEEQEKKIKEVLGGQEPKDSDDLFYALLKKLCGANFKPYHKYICVVQADGDNMGKVVNDLEDGKLKVFSEELIGFDVEAKGCIETFGGLPIYAGGDDLLFIAPVVGHSGTIFDLLDGLDAIFRGRMYDQAGECKYSSTYKPSMSYGVSISYYKYPLYEALEQSRHLLFSTAKKVKDKNAVAWALRRNSGSSVAGAFCKETKIKERFDDLLKSVEENKIDGNYISSVAHKVRANREVLKLIIRSENYKDRLSAFFRTFLGLKEGEDKTVNYLASVKDLVEDLIGQYQTIPLNLVFGKEMLEVSEEMTVEEVWERITDKITEEVYCILRTVKFLKGLEESHE